jgi:SAM-dependent methyltransferase
MSFWRRTEQQSAERPPEIDKLDFVATYAEHTKTLLERHDNRAEAMEQAIGGEFVVIGKMQKDLMVHAGLKADDCLVDVGCGSGRLAVQLSDWFGPAYLGTDVVQDLLDHASGICRRPDWQFQLVNGLSVPMADNTTDMISSFSIFTHLLHEESYLYMKDCYRTLRDGGRLVFSFLEYAVSAHWAVMESNLLSVGTREHLNQFMSLDGIEAWAKHLDFKVVDVFHGNELRIPLSEPVEMNGETFEDFGSLGQSVAIFQK